MDFRMDFPDFQQDRETGSGAGLTNRHFSTSDEIIYDNHLSLSPTPSLPISSSYPDPMLFELDVSRTVDPAMDIPKEISSQIEATTPKVPNANCLAIESSL
jgi:hypothetical protein